MSCKSLLALVNIKVKRQKYFLKKNYDYNNVLIHTQDKQM